MNCKDYQDVILTDFTDGESSPATKVMVERHLESCVQCREFAQAARQSIVDPFEGLERKRPPETVWRNIKAEIASREAQAVSRPVSVWGGLADGLGEWLAGRRMPAFAAATAAVAVVVAVTLLRPAPDVELARIEQLQEDMDYIAYLMDVEDDILGDGYETAIEEYFL